MTPTNRTDFTFSTSIFMTEQTERRNYKRRNENTNTLIGKLPPQAIDFEQAVLGALMLEKINTNSWASVKPEHFYEERHEKICKAIISLRDTKSPIDILTVTATLRKAGELELIGGAYYITELTNRVASSANIEYHIMIIHQMFLKRELIRIGMSSVNNCYDDTSSPFEEIKQIISQIKDLEKGVFKRSEKSASDLGDEILIDMDEEITDGMLGFPTGIKGIDSICRGDQKGSMRLVAAPTSVGKTIELCSEVLNSCFDENKELLKKQIPTAVFSLEMTAKQLSYRLISNLTSIGNTKIKLRQLTDQERSRVFYFTSEFKKAQIYIDDTPGLNICEFEAKAAVLAGIGVEKIYIDYYQLMKGDPNKKYGLREQELADISRRLKVCAKELGIAIIIYAQVSKEVEKRPLCIPTKNDIRECTAITHDADVILLIWRPEYYEHVLSGLIEKGNTINCKLFETVINVFENMCFIIVDKNRDGELGKIPVKFNGAIMRISDHPQVLDYINGNKNIFSNSNNFQPTSLVEDKF